MDPPLRKVVFMSIFLTAISLDYLTFGWMTTTITMMMTIDRLCLFPSVQSLVDPGFPPRWVRQLSGGEPTHDFAKFSQKLHEVEKVWTQSGEALVPRAP